MPDEKTCATCGRRIEWRKKWERDWKNVRYCSQRCRTRKIRPLDGELERHVIALIESGSNSIRLPDAARAVDPSTAKGPIRIRRSTGR